MKPASEYPKKLQQVLHQIRREPTEPRWHARAIHLLRWDAEVAGNPAVQGFHPETHELLLELFRSELGQVRRVATVAASQLRGRHNLDGAHSVSELNQAAESLADDPLFQLFLTKTLNTDFDFEDFLKRLRLHLWSSSNEEPHHTLLISTIAEQAWHTEYVWTETKEESDQVEQAIQQWSGDPASLAKIAMYRSLDQLQRDEELMNAAFPDSLSHLIQLQITHRIEESELASTIPSLGEVRNPVNSQVQQQYEKHPYPKWFRLLPPFPSVESRIAHHSPGFTYPRSIGASPQSILVAGGGTGQHTLRLALGNPESDVVCLDLSLASLSYAKRMAKQLGVENIEFVRGDLLDIGRLDRSFDHIDTVGTLHHIDDPGEGWRTLSACLRPGGTLHVGVYSEVARLPVHRIREEIEERGIGSSVSEMKAFREELIQRRDDEPFLRRLFGHDFFQVSALRDLLFHTSEYCYRLPEIVDLVKELNLDFLAFDSHVPDIRRAWKLIDRSPDAWDDPSALAKREMALAGSMALLFVYLKKPGE